MAPRINRHFYKFEYSHFCEKARWALEYKGLRHERHEVLPVIGQMRLKARTGSRQVPVLIDDSGDIVADSTKILEYLERRHPTPRLFPTDPAERERMLEIEDWADEKLGKGIRAYLMATWKEDPRVSGGLKAFAGLNPMMLKKMGPDYCGYATFDEAKRDFPEQIKKIEGYLGSNSHLVGDRFTAADLTVCALLAPLYRPPSSPLPFPWAKEKPAFAADPEFRRIFEWIDFIYAEYRHATPGLSQ